MLFWIVLTALLLVAGGTVFLEEWLRANPVLFVLYWGACLWLTITSLLMALYDLLAIRVEARRERERLKNGALGKDEEPHP